MDAEPKGFDEILLDSIDEAFLSLGESVRKSIYYNIEIKFKVPRHEIPQNLQGFQESLEKIFGVAARFLEILIMKNLYKKIGCPFTVNKTELLEFTKYVDAAKQNFNKPKNT
ncbi:MAG: hypothetical protein ACQXXJ_07920 [Candidatus Bathyarchaeia archaeon]|jgi:hypothetical protein